MTNPKSILVCGATGLVGHECVELLLRDESFSRVVTLSRRPIHIGPAGTAHPEKLEQHIVDFDDLDSSAELFRVDQVLCAFGTTIKKAGTRERFHQVDFEYPYKAASLGAAQGAQHFLLVSAMGADTGSRVFYSRVKGELEDAVSSLSYRSLTIIRPSLLLGERQEFRFAEEIGKRLAFLFPDKYKPVTAKAVAAALVAAAKADRPGQRIIESRDIRSFPESVRRQA